MIGRMVGHYRILERLGGGGMGVVYKAEDTKLDRVVALKFLPNELTRDDIARKRFLVEARAAAKLDHPNICTVHEIGETDDGETFIAMAYYDGESLAARLERGPLPVEEAVRIAIEVARGLGAAHEAGIIHRDIKPANIMLTDKGEVKVVDFGIAKLGGATVTRTSSSPGTLAYMAPEQIQGEPVTPATDLWALGAVLYEMVTGSRPFPGDYAQAVAYSILHDEAKGLDDTSGDRPTWLDRIVRSLLAKDAAARPRSASELINALETLSDGIATGNVLSVASRRKWLGSKSYRTMFTGLALLLAVPIGIGLWSITRPKASTSPLPGSPSVHADLLLTGEFDVAWVNEGRVVLSHDGSRLLFRGKDGIKIRDLASGESKRLENTEGALFPFWSPDSSWIGYFDEGTLWKVPSAGGPAQALCEAEDGRGGTWGSDGTILFAPASRGPLVRVDQNGGQPVSVTSTVGRNESHRNPVFLPDGRHFLFVAVDSLATQKPNTMMGTLDGGECRIIAANALSPDYSSGYLFFVRDGNLLAQTFDPETMNTGDTLIPLASGVEYYLPRGVANYSVVDSGVLVLGRSSPPLSQLAWLDRAGELLETVGEPDYIGRLVLSADGKTAASVKTDSSGRNGDIWIVDLQRGLSIRSTFIASDDEFRVALSPDGSRLAYSILDVVRIKHSTMPADTSDDLSFPGVLWDWSGDGRYILLQTQFPGTMNDISWVSVDDPTTVRRLPGTRYDELAASFSRDGRCIAYSSDETGAPEVYVTDFPARSQTIRVSASGGWAPRWSGNGRELYFGSPAGPMAAAVYHTDEFCDVGPAEALPFSRRDILLASVESADGNRFLVRIRVEGEAPRTLKVISNWQSYLSARSPTGAP